MTTTGSNLRVAAMCELNSSDLPCHMMDINTMIIISVIYYTNSYVMLVFPNMQPVLTTQGHPHNSNHYREYSYIHAYLII